MNKTAGSAAPNATPDLSMLPQLDFVKPKRLYVHVPWCRTICPYCDFNVYPLRRQSRPPSWYGDAICIEQQFWQKKWWPQNPTQYLSVYLGGGTPSLLGSHEINSILGLAIVSETTVSGTIECTLEANPEDVDAASIERWKQAGVNRISLGVQSFQPEILKVLGRGRASAKMDAALELVAGNFSNWSLDLIYGWHGQTSTMWLDDLQQVLRWRPSHLSAYTLTIEAGTPLARWQKRLPVSLLQDDDVVCDMYTDVCSLEPYQAYEVSNFCLPGMASQHNQAYWLRQSYLGLGPGAHGLLYVTDGSQYRYTNVADPVLWHNQVQHLGHGVAAIERLSSAEIHTEQIMLGMRNLLGVDRAILSAQQLQQVFQWQEQGFVYNNGDHFILAEPYWFAADTFIVELLEGQNDR